MLVIPSFVPFIFTGNLFTQEIISVIGSCVHICLCYNQGLLLLEGVLGYNPFDSCVSAIIVCKH